jgi:hypothetical protein
MTTPSNNKHHNRVLLAQQRLIDGLNTPQIIDELEALGASRLEAEEILDSALQIAKEINHAKSVSAPDHSPAMAVSRLSATLRRFLWFVLIAGGVIVAAIFLLDEEQSPSTSQRSADQELIRQNNLDAVTPEPGITTVRSFELQVGDCIRLDQKIEVGETFEFEGIMSVPCESEWDYRISKKILVPDVDGNQYPGVPYLQEQGNTLCSAQDDIYFHPSVDTWPLGDRVITCAVER